MTSNTSAQKLLSPDRGLIFRITHVGNVPWILEHGLHCQSASLCDPDFIPIGNPELIGKRTAREIPLGPGGNLSDYIPFYFTPWSPMQMNILTGRNAMERKPEEIIFIVTSLDVLEGAGVRYVISDRHAYLLAADFAADRTRLGTMIPWEKLKARDFKRDPEEPEAFDRYQAEALVHGQLPVEAILGLACYTDAIRTDLKRALTRRDIELHTAVRADWYFR